MTEYPLSEYGHPKLSVIAGGGAVDLKLPVSFATVDAAPLLVVPTAFRLRLTKAWWETLVAFTGGTSAAIGASCSNTKYNTKGDVHGGASGDVLATMIVGTYGGTLGTKLGSNGVIVFEPGDIIRFDRITSAFTAGSGFLHMEVVGCG